MVFRIQNRVPRGQANTVGIRMNQHREALAKAVEAASLVQYSSFHSGSQTGNSTTPIGITPGVGAKADRVAVHVGTQGTGAVTVDVLVDGTSILDAVINLDVDTGQNPLAVTGAVVFGTLKATAKEALAANKRITVAIVGAASGAADLTVDVQFKAVHSAVGK